MRPRTGQLWRVAAGVAIAIGAVGAAGMAASAAPLPKVGGGTAMVGSTVPGGPAPSTIGTQPAPTASPTDPTPSPSSTCTECECEAEPTPTSTIQSKTVRLDSRTGTRPVALAAFAAPVAAVTVQFNITTNAVGAAAFGAPAVVAVPATETAGFTNRAIAFNARGCYTLTFQNVFLKCKDPVITINPGNITARTKFKVTEVPDPAGDYWAHKNQFTDDANPGKPLLNKTITVVFTCERV